MVVARPAMRPDRATQPSEMTSYARSRSAPLARLTYDPITTMLDRFFSAYFPQSELAVSFFPPPTKFDPAQAVPDLTGKVRARPSAPTRLSQATHPH